MSTDNVTPFPIAGSHAPTRLAPTAGARELLDGIQSAIISAQTATAALEAIEDRLAESTATDDKALYASIWLVRDKLASVLEQAEESCEAIFRLHQEQRV
jgi:hypothetical protein